MIVYLILIPKIYGFIYFYIKLVQKNGYFRFTKGHFRLEFLRSHCLQPFAKSPMALSCIYKRKKQRSKSRTLNLPMTLSSISRSSTKDLKSKDFSPLFYIVYELYYHTYDIRYKKGENSRQMSTYPFD